MIRLRHIALLGTLAGTLAGCATGPAPVAEQLLQQNEAMAKLSRNLESARSQGTTVFAPESFNRAQEAMNNAATLAQAGKNAEASAAAQQGIEALNNASAAARITRDLMLDVAEARERAVKANAPQLFPENMAAADETFADAAAMIEQNKIEQAQGQRPKLVALYAKLELDALKEGTAQAAKASIERAEENGAAKFAPKTLKMAQDELSLSQSVLEADRTQTAKANDHAQRAIDIANRAIHVSELVKDFDVRGFSGEDIVLWYQDQLTTISAPLSRPPNFSDSNRNVVDGLRTAVTEAAGLRDQLGQAQISAAESVTLRDQEILRLKQQHQAELTALKQQYEQKFTAQANVASELERQNREEQARFDRVQTLFAESEAAVYRQRNNVLISAQGFNFASGKSDISPDNFGLLNKIVAAVGEFPNARIEVSGHTDSLGDPQKNSALSQARAANVARFLTEVGGIPASRVSGKGFGSDKPVAPNDTAENRARNRRIEVLIVNP
jgi:outer membrane protein OmpA-like peptidoglycan-associated protein